MDVVLVMFKDSERRDFPVAEKKTVLGRRQDCHLRIPTRDISRQHCAILLDKNKVVAKDLGSSNGTFVNGKRIAETELKPGDRLRLGPVTFIVQINGKPAQVKPDDALLKTPAAATPVPKGKDEDEETFDLSDGDFDLDDPMAALDEEDEKDMP